MNFLGMLAGVALFGFSAFRQFGGKKSAVHPSSPAGANPKGFAPQPAAPTVDDSAAKIAQLEKEAAAK